MFSPYRYPSMVSILATLGALSIVCWSFISINEALSYEKSLGRKGVAQAQCSQTLVDQEGLIAIISHGIQSPLDKKKPIGSHRFYWVSQALICFKEHTATSMKKGC